LTGVLQFFGNPIITLKLCFAIYFTKKPSKLFIIRAYKFDFFREVPVIPHANYGLILSLKIISEQHLLMETLNGLILLKVNYETWEVSVVSKHILNLGWIGEVIVDRLNRRNLFIFGFRGFVTGKLTENNIVLNPHREFAINYLRCINLAGNQLCGLHYMGRNRAGDWMWQYCKIDLATLAEETIDVPITFDENLSFYPFKVSFYLIF
jgi:hypothetical protein